MTDAEILEKIARVPFWYHRIRIRPGIVTPGINDTEANLRLLDLPQDCSGLRVLDLGARDGFFSFELERRGADVLAVDYVAAEETGFAVVADLLGSKVRFLRENLYNLSAESIGTFDIVLFLGLLYHLPDPLGAIRKVRSLCRGRLYLESLIIDGLLYLADGTPVMLQDLDPRLLEVPVMQFFPGASRNNDRTNFWGPNMRCLLDMLTESEFLVVRSEARGDRGIVVCDVESDAQKRYDWEIGSGAALPGISQT